MARIKLYINILLNLLLILIAGAMLVIFLVKLFVPIDVENILNGILLILCGVSALILVILFKTMDVKKYLSKSKN